MSEASNEEVKTAPTEAPKDVTKSDTALREEAVLKFWQEQNIFEQSLAKPASQGDFVFYDGPPFATGLPHHGSLLSSIIKDVVPRYKTMRGYRVPRVWGWDCHGLPIENLVEKQLGLKTKKDILSIGIDMFNETARSLVLQYVADWEQYVDRIGRWVDFKHSYKTMDNEYIESVWWGLKRLNEKSLLYEGQRVLMYCTHCETPLAKAEIAADNTYKDITEEATTVKFELVDHPGTFFLAWTTTPWTLPGNVALAVGPNIEYSKVKTAGGTFILATERLADVFADTKFEVLGTLKGKEIAGGSYKPLFDVPTLKNKTAYKVYTADFVTTTEGTGIVHTAVMYGEDDYALGLREKLPTVQLLNPNGTYNSDAPEFVRGEYIKKGEVKIKDDLTERGLIFARAMHMHSYPHCWRCGTPLIYNAVPSWFVNIQKIKQKMLSENEKINWVPGHLKEGRFKNIVQNAPDWTISRNRFWASPLPIWKEKGGKKLMVVGSLKELLAKTKNSGNKYFVMRHGEALNNTEGVVASMGAKPYPLTEKGKEQATRAGQQLKSKKIDLIIVSPVLRARETAALVQKELGLPETAVMVDERLREVGVGVFEGKPFAEYAKFFGSFGERFVKTPEGGESYTEIWRRCGEVLFDIESRYAHKNVLLVTHFRPVTFLQRIARGEALDSMRTQQGEGSVENAQPIELPFVPFPHNKNFELDLHRPYIDAVTLIDEKGASYERIPEVVDCWVESGAMPFASVNYPRDTSRVDPMRFFGLFPKGYPADFIAEYIAQTRTWFYYLLAMSVGLFGKTSFRAVVSTGTILAADGSKVSKSKKNYTDPLLLIDRHGADALRLALMGSVVMAGEDLNFRDEDVREASRPLGVLWNSCQFFVLYRDKWDASVNPLQSPYTLDQWVLALLAKTTREVTEAFDRFDTPSVCRALREFIDDYSTWYVRRSRERVRGPEAAFALAVQRHVLLEVAKLLAPITPFLAEAMYKELVPALASIHLENWPTVAAVSKNEETLIADMKLVRAAVSVALQQREKAGVKVRQPLGLLQIHPSHFPVGAHAIAYLALVGEEVNVKKVEVSESVNAEAIVMLDATLTPELKEEGLVRDWVRRVQAWRKDEGLVISDRPMYELRVAKEEESIAKKYQSEIVAAAGLSTLKIVVGEDA